MTPDGRPTGRRIDAALVGLAVGAVLVVVIGVVAFLSGWSGSS